MKKINKDFLNSIILFVAFIAYTITASRVDVGPIGPNESKVGLSTINHFFIVVFPWNELFHNISTVLGYIIIAMAFGFFIYTIIDIVKKKSLKKADAGLIALMVYFALIVGIYILFDKVLIINYRPVILNVVLEPSYPSTHTFMAIAIMLALKTQFEYKIKDEDNKWFATTFCMAIIVATIFTRMVAGVHWFTDIIGGILLGSALASLYNAVARKIYNK